MFQRAKPGKKKSEKSGGGVSLRGRTNQNKKGGNWGKKR